MTIKTKTADAKGRVALGPRFANQPVIIKKIDETEVTVILATVIPAREAWLYENPEAKRAVLTGLEKATRREFSQDPPDLDRDAKLADRIEG